MPGQLTSVVVTSVISRYKHMDTQRSQDGHWADNGLYQCVQSDAPGNWDNGGAHMPVCIRRLMVRYADTHLNTTVLWYISKRREDLI